MRRGMLIGALAGAAGTAGIGCVFVLPVVMTAGALFGTTEYKDGIAPVASTTCGNDTAIQQVATTTPKVDGWSTTKVANAATIVAVGSAMKVPPRGWVIAVATAMQESKLVNLGNLGARNDHDSLGLFQQRPSSGWGTPAQIMKPEYAARKFYEKLLTVKGWQSMPLTDASQAVQISAYPNAYAKWESAAGKIVNAVSGGAAKVAAAAKTVGVCAANTDQVAASGWVRPVSAPIGSGWRTKSRPDHQGVDLIADKGTKVVAAAAGTVIHLECDRTERGYDCSHDGSSGDWPGGCGWYVDIKHAGGIITRYCHMRDKPLVHEGQKVSAGQQIGVVGSTGHSSGPHLHFEVHHGNRLSSSTSDPVPWMKEHGAPLGTSKQGGEAAS